MGNCGNYHRNHLFCLRFVFTIFCTGSFQVPPEKNHPHLKCRFPPKKWHSWLTLKPCFTKCTSLKRMRWFLTISAKNGSMEKQFEGLRENLHNKMHQTRQLPYNQRSITSSFLRFIRRRLWAVNIFTTG